MLVGLLRSAALGTLRNVALRSLRDVGLRSYLGVLRLLFGELGRVVVSSRTLDLDGGDSCGWRERRQFKLEPGRIASTIDPFLPADTRSDEAS